MDVGSSRAPTNIAVLKYWGKDAARGGNTPLNSSVSLTLAGDDLRAETVVVAARALKQDELWLNGARADTANDGTHAKRLRGCLSTMRTLCGRDAIPASSTAADAAELAAWKVRVVSRNTFPTAAGLASSAAGYAALVHALAQLYGVREKFVGELSTIARRGSGSACRSLDGGLVAWRKGCAADGSDSRADQLFDEAHWPELRVVVLVADAAEKETPSTEGMRRSAATSPFLAHRARHIAEPRLDEFRRAFKDRDFAAFGKITMRDSNSFHATCLDTYPPIFYLDETSKRAISIVHAFNESHGGVVAAYTFDAGPNAVVFCVDQAVADEFAALALELLAPTAAVRRCDPQALARFTNRPAELAAAAAAHVPAAALLRALRGSAAPCLKMMYLTSVGGGAAPLSPAAVAALVDVERGTPNRDAPRAQWQSLDVDDAPRAAPPHVVALFAAAAAAAAVAVARARNRA
ncbi:hypothetical protein M885DRAFT_538086 [Pelagophyceae sp. CCMP2097]|nr:hypothetical protein M885DRAFT_538086 [Pelagophyceae sp. CCMP2097]